MVLIKVLAVFFLIQVARGADPKEIAKKGQFPFHVSIQKLAQDKKYEHVCSGAILTSKFVVTAASCFTDLSSKYVVKAGLLNHAGDAEQSASVANVTFHDKYRPTYGLIYNEHDVAVVELAQNLTLNADTVKVIGLPKSGQKLNKTSAYTMIGYGFSKQGLDKSALKHFQAFAIDNEYCKKILAAARVAPVLYESQFCASEESKGNVYTVKGDSGNPLIEKTDKETLLIGLAASYSPTDFGREDKSIFTQVSLYTDWINQKTGNGAPSLTYGCLVLIMAAVSVAKNMFY